MTTPAISAPVEPGIVTTAGEAAPQTVASPVPAAIVPQTPPVELPPPDPQREAERAELAELRRKAADGELLNKARLYQRQLEVEGWPVELAEVQARTWFDKETAVARADSADAQSEQSAKVQVAQHLSTQYSVPVAVLMGYPTARTMVAAAERFGSDNKRIAALEQEIALLKGGAVPAQRLDSGLGSGGASDPAFLALYSAGKSNDHARAKKLLGL